MVSRVEEEVEEGRERGYSCDRGWMLAVTKCLEGFVRVFQSPDHIIN